MPSRPLSPDRQAITKLHSRIDVEAIAVIKGKTDRAAAVPRVAALVPPTRVDLVYGGDGTLRHPEGRPQGWPPYSLVCELVTAVKAVHFGEVKLRGENGETVEVVAYVDKMQTAGRSAGCSGTASGSATTRPSRSSASRWISRRSLRT